MEIAESNRASPATTGALGARFLVLAPSGADGTVLCKALSAAGIEALECESLRELHDRVREGAAGAILADETLHTEGVAIVLSLLNEQPEWSDLPLIVMARQGQEQSRAWQLLRKMNGAAHAVLLERPVHAVTLVSAVRAALRSRVRQYQVRDELERLRRAQEDLRQSNRRLEIALSAAAGGIYEHSIPLDDTTYHTHRGAEILGLGPDEVPADTRFLDWVFERVHPDDQARLESSYRDFLSGRSERSEVEVRLRHRDGHWVWVHAFARAIDRDPGGRARRVIGMMIDISERKRAQEELDRFFSLSLELLAIASTLDGHWKRVNPAFCDTLGFSQEELLAMPFMELVHPRDLSRSMEATGALAVGEPLVQFEHRVKCKNGGYRWIAWQTASDTESGLLYCAGRDVTQRREETEALRESERRLRELNDTLEQRVAERTAELERQTRQLRLLANELTQAEQRERKTLARTLHDGLQQMLLAIRMQLPFCEGEGREEALRKIGELVDESMRMAHSLAYELSPPVLEVSGLPAALEWLARWFAENHRFDVYLDVSADFPTVAENIKVFLFNAVRELLFNAIKHSGAKEAFVVLQTAGPEALHIEVSDEGVGFDATRLDEAVETSGFGLFSIRERLGALGGSLHVESSPGEGARFTIEMPPTDEEATLEAAHPIEPSVVEPATEGSWTPGEPVRVLLVDDHVMIREGLATMIRQREGFELVGQAADGIEAIERTEDLRPDVVVMDIRMPNMDGIEATRRIKERHPHVQVVGLCLQTIPGQAEAMIQAGATVCLRKDGAAETLFDAMSAVGRRSN